MKEGLVSCIIPTYKRSDTLTRAVDSVLNQTYKNVEVLVVDDNIPNSEESDVVKKVLEKYHGDKRVRYISQVTHINGAVARNVGINAAEGEFVAFLDDDDEWLSEKVEKQVDFLKQNPEVGGVSCLYIIKKDGAEVRRCHPYSGDNFQFKVLSRQIAVFTSTFLGRRELVIQSGAFNPNLIRHQDLQFLTDFLNVTTMQPINEYMVNLHIDSDINRPNVMRFIAIKKDFFNAVKNTISEYDKQSQKRIYNAHYFEIIVDAVKEKKFLIVIKYLFKIGISIQSYKDVFCRFFSRK